MGVGTVAEMVKANDLRSFPSYTGAGSSPAGTINILYAIFLIKKNIYIHNRI